MSPYALSHPIPSLILPLLRSTTNNENIFAEHCDLTSATSIRNFCTSFLTQNDTRIDALIFAHEYSSIGRIWFLGGVDSKNCWRGAAWFDTETLEWTALDTTGETMPPLRAHTTTLVGDQDRPRIRRREQHGCPILEISIQGCRA